MREKEVQLVVDMTRDGGEWVWRPKGDTLEDARHKAPTRKYPSVGGWLEALLRTGEDD